MDEVKTQTQPKIGNGSMRLTLRGNKFYTIWGGPYTRRPAPMFGFKLAQELPLGYDLKLDIPDFSVPKVELLNHVLREFLPQFLAGEPVYVGCMGGKGRTGLFLAILAKVFGVPNPVEYVRENYFDHAVETRTQYEFVMSYQPPAELLWMISKARSRWNYKVWFKTDLTAPPNLS